MVKKALRPSYFDPYKDIGTLTKEEQEEQDLDEVQSIHGLSEHKGWRYLSLYIDKLKEDLDNLNQGFIERGASYEEIGKNTVTIQLCKDILSKVQIKVKDAHEEIEQQPRGPGGEPGRESGGTKT